MIDEISRLQTELERRAVTQLLQETEQLTPEQRKQYLLHFENRMRQGFARGRRNRRGGAGRQDELGQGGTLRRGGKGQGGRGMGRRQKQ